MWGETQGGLLLYIIPMTSDIRRSQFLILNVEIVSMDVQTVSFHSMGLYNRVELARVIYTLLDRHLLRAYCVSDGFGPWMQK